MRFFTSDEHFYHANMLKYASRPFKNLTEMHKELIRRHNSVVTEADTVYHIGDFGFFPHSDQIGSVLRQLNGTHVLILGNHCEYNPFVYERHGFRGVHTVLELDNGWILVHDPSKACTKRDRQFITGHLHSLPEARRSMNFFDVGVDGNNYYPYSQSDLNFLLT